MGMPISRLGGSHPINPGSEGVKEKKETSPLIDIFQEQLPSEKENAIEVTPVPLKGVIAYTLLDDLKLRCRDIFLRIWMSDSEVTTKIPQLNRNYRGLLSNREQHIQLLKAKILRKASSMIGGMTPSQDKERALAYLAEMQTQSDVEKAVAIAQTIESKWAKGKALFEIVKVQARNNLKEALENAQTIEPGDWQNQALIEIIKELARNDPAEAIVVAQTWENIYQKAYCEIIKIQAQRDLKQAFVAIETMEENVFKSKILAEIVKVQAQHDPTQALLMVQAIKSPLHKSEALHEIIKVQARRDVKKALEITQTLRITSRKGAALLEIVKIQAQNDPKEALLTAQTIEDAKFRALAKLWVVKALLFQSNIQEAKRIVATIENPSVEDDALIEIVKAQAQSNLEQALATIKESKPGTQYKALLEIVIVLPQTNLTQALTFAQTLNDDLKTEALLEIAKVQIKSDLQAAENTLIQLLLIPNTDFKRIRLLNEFMEGLLAPYRSLES
jgi:hypothetical protein